VAALILDVSARETAAAVIAIAPFLVGRIQSAREHASLAGRRLALEKHIQAVLDPGHPSSDIHVRTAQDELYRLRMETRRIPNWLYNRYAEDDRASIDAAITARIEAFRDAIRP
jgi:exoribonuclease II